MRLNIFSPVRRMYGFAWIVLALVAISTGGTGASKVVAYQFEMSIPNSHSMLLNTLTEELTIRGHTVLVRYCAHCRSHF
jgi:hypothetical protein